MNYQVYFPNDVRKNLFKLWKSKKQALLVGYKVEHVYIIVQSVENNIISNSSLPTSLEGLRVIGAINNEKYDLCFSFNDDNLPVVESGSDIYVVIFFDPPKYKNLEYFSISPILLQSTSREVHEDNVLVKRFNKLEKSDESPRLLSINDEVILDKINQIMKIRTLFKQWRESFCSKNLEFARVKKLAAYLRFLVFKVLVNLVLVVQNIAVFLIKVLNYKIRGISLIQLSHVVRQADLRLKQINYFPIQFLCYYDKSILYTDSMLFKELNLPIFNSNLNINNSNYINLYNSLWMICNDIILGNIAYNIIETNSEHIKYYINTYLIQDILYERLCLLITWVSFENPAGFKLNNQLGLFIGELILWTLSFWNIIIKRCFMIPVDYPTLNKFLPTILRLLCYCGSTFVIAGMIDFCQFITLQIYCFYYSLARIYKHQVDIIKSLFQLFRGKKYNVLRDRIDYIDSSPGDLFEIYRLLMGTLLFMVLIFLLPTVFAFYMVFFLIHMVILMTLNFLENLQITMNFLPLFVVLLKLKNSNRLQGGINFDYVGSNNTTTYIRLTNKSLSYKEIFSNFIKLLRNSKNFKKSLVQFFMIGEMILMNHDYDLKFNYLMLPGNFDKTIKVWKLLE